MGTDSGSGHTFEQPHRLARHLWRWLGRARPGAVLHILDFGSGDGALGLALGARWAEQHQRLTQVTLVDHHPHAAFSHPQVRLHTRTELDGTIPPADLVLASAILEHVHAPEQVLGALVDRLAPGGLLYARTPWMLPIARLLSKVDFGYPAHLHDLGPAWWNGVARRHGWPVRALASRPSIVETTLRTHPVRALAAHVLKVPGHLESWLRGPESTGHRWGWVGGWEVVWQRAADVAV
jgi:SAM-dependent methyltransferase